MFTGGCNIVYGKSMIKMRALAFNEFDECSRYRSLGMIAVLIWKRKDMHSSI